MIKKLVAIAIASSMSVSAFAIHPGQGARVVLQSSDLAPAIALSKAWHKNIKENIVFYAAGSGNGMMPRSVLVNAVNSSNFCKIAFVKPNTLATKGKDGVIQYSLKGKTKVNTRVVIPKKTAWTSNGIKNGAVIGKLRAIKNRCDVPYETTRGNILTIKGDMYSKPIRIEAGNKPNARLYLLAKKIMPGS